MTTLEIEQFGCRADNFGVLIHNPKSGETVAIDAPELGPIVDMLERKGWDLTTILTTHHHGDHVEANLDLKSRYGVRIVGAKADSARIPGIDEMVSEGDTIHLLGTRIDVYETPGHTIGHICFHFPEEKLLFAADTLMALGCGRLFEGTPAMMWDSLKKLKELPDDTLLYCGHEYTQTNARFALTMDPNNSELQARSREIEQLRADGKPTLPVALDLEKRTNPFLRPDDPEIRKNLDMQSHSDVEVFAAIRSAKDRF